MFSKICVSNNLVGHIETNSYFAQYLLKDFLDPYNLFVDIHHVPYHGRKQAKIVSSLEMLPVFSKICVFNNLVGVTEMIL